MERNLSLFLTKGTAKKAGFVETYGKSDPLITGLEYDSRNIKPGNLFFALPGLHTDGNLYIDDAVKRGAAAVVHENDIEKKHNIVYIKVKKARHAMSPISASFYNFPSRHLLITGVTGTEGKSTTVYLIWQLLTMLGKKAGFISTVQYCLGAEVIWNSEHQTTPEAPVVQRLLREMADNGCEYVVVESSSHALSPKTNRLGDVDFCSAVLTNLTREHLEFHGTWEQYRDDKANLFRALNRFTPPAGSSFTEPFGVINADDRNSRYFLKLTHQKIFTYSPEGMDGDLVIEAIESGLQGNWYTVKIPALKETFELRDRLPGAFNSANVLAAMLTVSGLLKLPVQKIAPLVKKLKPVRGRMTKIDRGQNYDVIVDFAHTPSSFRSVLHPLRSRTEGRIICLFGSAGERDTEKRSEQGKIASQYTDIIVLTDEDPRGENSMDILEEIAAGTVTEEQAVFKRDENLFLIPDRPLAIRKALSLAQKGDLVILLGKGHENSIIYADHVMPYDEIAETEKALGEIKEVTA
ncbi:MAG: UDP-N-acetylmuramoyl-L-alanyl-D-glutamate--2,6-diaminopimelate ligase [Treponema sp.]|nr:UDP-N-acetylmuramoyl-L-alanyl-D-glutamate--2,6-diaminopimelate ligase [Treponema sp.]